MFTNDSFEIVINKIKINLTIDDFFIVIRNFSFFLNLFMVKTRHLMIWQLI